MKAIQNSTQILYWKDTETSWVQPLLKSNGTVKVSEMAVKEWVTAGGIRPIVHVPTSRADVPNSAWWAFTSESKFDGSHATGQGDGGGTYYMAVYVKVPIKATSIRFCFPGLDTDNDGGTAFRALRVYGSNNDSSWSSYTASSWIKLLDYSQSSSFARGGTSNSDAIKYSEDTTLSFTETSNFNFYNYYLIACPTSGGGHNDGMTICSVRLNATVNCRVPGTSTDYTFSEVVPAYKLSYRENKYWGLGE